MTIVLGKDFDNNPGGQMGEALGRGLQALAQHKIGKMMERHQVQKLGNAYEQMGFPRGLATLPESAQKAYIANNYPQPQQQQQQYAQQAEPLQQMQDMAPQEMMPQQTPDQLFKQFERVAFRPQNAVQNVAQAMSGGVKLPQVQPQLNLPKQAKAQAVPQIGLQGKQTVSAPVVQPVQTTKMEEPWQILQNKPRNKIEEKQFNEARKEQHYIEKEAKPYVEQLDKKGGVAAKMTDMVLGKMEKLINTGHLTGHNYYNIRKKLEQVGHIVGGGLGTALGATVGSVIPALGTVGGATIGGGLGTAAGAALTPEYVGTPEDIEFTKLGMTFMDKLKDLFGARPTVVDVENFMKSIPTLAQSDEGKKAVIRNMKLTAEGWKYMKKVKDEIVNRHGGHIPRNIEQLVEAESAPFMDKLSQKFIEG